MDDPLMELGRLVADHQTVLYGEWKNGQRTPGIVELIQRDQADRAAAKVAAESASEEAKHIREQQDRNRTLLWGSILTAGATFLAAVTSLVLRFMDVAAAHAK